MQQQQSATLGILIFPFYIVFYSCVMGALVIKKQQQHK